MELVIAHSNVNHFDVVIIGAGLSGIGAARKLQDMCPGKSFVILEGRDTLGGTWDLFRYPGIRSDSDMFTMSYENKPWLGDTNVVSDGSLILSYLKEAATERGIDSHIRFGHKVTAAAWSTEKSRWTIESTNQQLVTGNILFVCSGYYNYKKGYTPEFKGADSFEGTIVHPQQWPGELNYAGKRVVVIGSGATAVTLVPAMAKTASHVTMLQRSPTYVISWPSSDIVAKFLKFLLPKNLAHRAIRLKNIYIQRFFYHQAQVNPERAKQQLLKMVRKNLGTNYDVEKHFTPKYKPWEQRLCLVPDADLFKAIKSGQASVATDEIESFQPRGIQLKSGAFLEADIIVTATGLDLAVLGGIKFSVDDAAVDFPETFSYRGMMFSGVPNLIHSFGYINASWTLRSELVAEFSCRLVNHMSSLKASQCTPVLREQDQEMVPKYLIENFSSGYVARGMHLFTRQGDREPWQSQQNYLQDLKQIRNTPIDDDVLRFTNPPVRHRTVDRHKSVDLLST